MFTGSNEVKATATSSAPAELAEKTLDGVFQLTPDQQNQFLKIIYDRIRERRTENINKLREEANYLDNSLQDIS